MYVCVCVCGSEMLTDDWQAHPLPITETGHSITAALHLFFFTFAGIRFTKLPFHIQELSINEPQLPPTSFPRQIPPPHYRPIRGEAVMKWEMGRGKRAGGCAPKIYSTGWWLCCILLFLYLCVCRETDIECNRKLRALHTIKARQTWLMWRLL